MKNSSILLIAFGALSVGLILASCSKKNGSGSGGGTGDGTFSVTVDGKTITGTDKYNNAIIVIAADPTSQFDSAGDIFLDMFGQGDSIGVHLPDRTGATDVGGTGLSQFYGVITLPDTFYLFLPVHFNVTSLTKSRIQGTFSGSASTSLLPGGKTITLTNGTFNLPILQ